MDFTTMANSLHSHNSNHIRDLVDDPVITDPNPPVVLRSGEFATAGRPRIFSESSKRSRNAGPNPGGQALEVFLGRALDEDLIHPSALREIGEHVVQWPIVELLPPRFF